MGARRWRHVMARYNYQRRRGKAALDAATTTEKENKALDPRSGRG